MILEDLRKTCYSRSIPLEDRRYSQEELLRLLRNRSITSQSLQSQKYLQHFFSPMLCHLFNTISNDEKKAILEDKNWIAEPKYYGNRVFITYFKGEGLKFYSRKLSEITFLPEDITEKVYFHLPTINSEISFILDGMIILDSRKAKSTSDVYLAMEDNAVSYIMSLPTEESLTVQQNYAKFSVVSLDIVMINNKNTSCLPFFQRRKLLEDLVGGKMCRLTEPLPFIVPPQITDNKIEYFEHCIDNGYQGVVLKNITKSYNATNKRYKDLALKIKRNCCSYTDDIDLFITGLDKDGNVELSSYFTDRHGVTFEAVVGSVRPSRYIKSEGMVSSDFFGDEILSPLIIGQVVVCKTSGFDYVNKKFNSIHVKWRKGFRTDKSRIDCVLTEDIVGARFLRHVVH